MTDRLLLWLVSCFPIALMLGVIFAARWRRLQRAPASDIVVILLVSAVIIGGLAWRLTVPESAATHVFLQNRYALLLAIPACVFLIWLQQHTLSGISRGRMWLAFLLRSACVILVALALAGLQMVVERDALTVVFALDISKSIPESERQRAIDFIRKTRSLMKPNDEAGLVVFGGRAASEISPTNLFEAPALKDIKSVVEPNSTNIGNALRFSAAAFDESSRRRLVLFTDGRQTTGNAAEELKRLVSQGVDVWIAPLKNGDTAEMLIEKVIVPSELLWEQVFDAHVYVWSNVKAEATVNLYPGDPSGPPKLSRKVELLPGKNRVTFSGLKMHSGGAKEIRAVLEPAHAADDTLDENNESWAFTDVQTDSRVLILTSDLKEVQNLLGAFEGEKISLDVRSPASLPNSPEDYRAYDCIILANLARGFLSNGHMEVIESCVHDQGAGLIMIGGDQSYGAGGYLGTPIENALPVRMDLQNERVMPSGALCIVLHTCEFGEGNAWGKKISKAAINVLSPQDYAGLIDYENTNAESWTFKPMLVARKQAMFQLIDNCDPGDMPSLERIVFMAVTELAKLVNVSKKHVIIITDGDPQPPQPGTIAAAKNAGISISAVSIFPHGGGDLNALRDVCTKTGGNYYQANDPKKLPQIFIKEAAIVRKNLIHPPDASGPPVPVSLGVPGSTLKDFGNQFPAVRALVMTRQKEQAELQLYTMVKGEKIPILASWHYGLGQAVAFTSDSSPRWAPDWVGWPSYKKFWTNVLRDASRKRMPSNHTVSTRIEDGVAHVVVEALDSKGDYLNFGKLAGSAIEPKGLKAENEGNIHTLKFAMTQAGRYEATFPVDKTGAYSITIIDQTDPKHPQSIVTGVANSYSAEFAHTENDDALFAQLNEIASTPGGTTHLKDLEKLNPLESGVFAHDNTKPTSQPTDLFKWLLIAAACLFPLDVAVRRLALDPERFFLWLYGFIEPFLLALRLKKRQIQAAATNALAGQPGASPPPQDIVPTGSLSRDAQGRYEQAGDSAAAQNLNLDPNARGTKPAVGGTKLSPVEKAASEYTGALLKAKKRARKE